MDGTVAVPRACVVGAGASGRGGSDGMGAEDVGAMDAGARLTTCVRIGVDWRFALGGSAVAGAISGVRAWGGGGGWYAALG